MQHKVEEEAERDRIEVLCEFFETIIQSILYVRQIYPRDSFEKTVTRCTNQITYTSRHKEVREYVGNCILSMKPWLKKRLVKQLVLLIIVPNVPSDHENGVCVDVVVERFVFELNLFEDMNLNVEDESENVFGTLYWLLRDFYVKVHSLKNQHLETYKFMKNKYEQYYDHLSFRVQIHLRNDNHLDLVNKLDWTISKKGSDLQQQQQDEEGISSQSDGHREEKTTFIVPLKSVCDSNVGVQLQLLLYVSK